MSKAYPAIRGDEKEVPWSARTEQCSKEVGGYWDSAPDILMPNNYRIYTNNFIIYIVSQDIQIFRGYQHCLRARQEALANLTHRAYVGLHSSILRGSSGGESRHTILADELLFT